jgi:hypothetical protein
VAKAAFLYARRTSTSEALRERPRIVQGLDIVSVSLEVAAKIGFRSSIHELCETKGQRQAKSLNECSGTAYKALGSEGTMVLFWWNGTKRLLSLVINRVERFN